MIVNVRLILLILLTNVLFDKLRGFFRNCPRRQLLSCTSSFGASGAENVHSCHFCSPSKTEKYYHISSILCFKRHTWKKIHSAFSCLKNIFHIHQNLNLNSQGVFGGLCGGGGKNWLRGDIHILTKKTTSENQKVFGIPCNCRTENL